MGPLAGGCAEQVLFGRSRNLLSVDTGRRIRVLPLVAPERFAAGRLVEPVQIPSPDALFLRYGRSFGVRTVFVKLLKCLHAGLVTEIILPAKVVGHKFRVGVFYFHPAYRIDWYFFVSLSRLSVAAMHSAPP